MGDFRINNFYYSISPPSFIDKSRTMEPFIMDYLGNNINQDLFLQIGRKIASIRKTRVVYPNSSEVFRAFKETPIQHLKVVLLFQDPYHNGSADGLATSCSRTGISTTLQIMLREIDLEYPEWINDLNYGREDRKNLSRWAKQGVLLLNTALTVEKGKPESHTKIWEPITTAVVKTINSKQDIVWGLFGTRAHYYKKFITNPTHTVFKVAHPAAEAYGSKGFIGCGVFRKINEELEARNKSIIQW